MHQAVEERERGILIRTITIQQKHYTLVQFNGSKICVIIVAVPCRISAVWS